MSVNEAFFNFLHSLAGVAWPLDWAIIFFAEFSGYALLAAVVLMGLQYESRKERASFYLFVLASLVIASSVVILFRYFVESPRPFMALDITPLVSSDLGNSFPSGHASVYIALAVAVFFRMRKMGVWFLGAALLIGLARIAAGVHWPLDIAGGILVGTLAAYIALRLLPQPGGIPQTAHEQEKTA